jgi:molybdopterin-containing oxidoreductase family iron-sulfur binding subunit
MGIDRRRFLKIAGLSALGFSARPLIDLLCGDRLFASQILPNPKALKAKRWAMIVDLKKINKDVAKKCIEACHKIHNVPDISDQKREVKWIWTESFEHAFPDKKYEYSEVTEQLKDKPILVFCNNCDNPPCVRVCPTKATFKREDGIVMMDMHRCIGCRFCMAACPYGSRSFNWMDPRPYIDKENMEYPTREKGVVEKCDFCVERIDNGLMPACVEASGGALIFGDVGDPNSEVRKILRSRYAIRRKPSFGTGPQIYYLI